VTAPKKGTRGTYQSMHGGIVGFVVSSVDGNLCYAVYATAPDAKPAPFIWRFRDGLNDLHDWPGKPVAAPMCPYCGTETGLRQVHDGGGFTKPEYTCEDCSTPRGWRPLLR